MKLTSKGRYAVMAMADLAKINANQPTSLTEISLRQGISISFLEQIFLKLKKNNLVQSSRGPSGGYFLAKLPDSEEPIITETKKVVHTLNSLCTEMDVRYNLLKDAQARIKELNARRAELINMQNKEELK